MDVPLPSIYWDPKELRGAHYQEVTPGTEDVLRHAEVDSVIEDSILNILSPYETSASVRILDLATTMTVTMLFSNTTDGFIREGYFSFPLPSTCSLTKFRFFIGDDRVITGKAKPTLKAVADFSGAIHNRKTAARIKQETSEIFTAALGNLPPQGKLKAEVSMVMMLKEKIPDRLPTRISTLSIPTHVAPRYGELPTSYLKDTISNPEVQHDLSITVEAIFAGEVIDVISRTHEISYEHRSGPRPTDSWGAFVHGDSLSQEPSNIVTVKLKKPLSALDGDFVLDFVTKPSASTSAPHAYLERHPTLHDHHAVMVTIPSNILVDTHSKIDDSEVLFLMDLSGSMSNKRSSLKSAIKFFLNGIPVNRRFNIWSFGSTYSSLWPKSKSKSKDTLSEALEHVESEVKKDLGGTELLPALKAIFNGRSSEKSSMTSDILLLTDGEVWREAETIEFVNSARKHSGYCVRFFCLGIGDAVSHSLVEGVAKAGGGYSEVVPAKSQTGWEDRVVLMLKAALHTHIGPVKMDIGEETKSGFRPWADESFLKSPTDISMLSPFVTNKVLMLFETMRLPINRAVIRLTTTDSSGREQVRKIKPTPFHSEQPVIHQLVARELLRDLEHGRHWLVHPSEDSLRLEGERIACKWSLVSKWTCLIAVEECRPKAKHDTLPDAILDSINSLIQIKPEEWVPDLLRPIRGPKTTPDFQKDIAIGIESDSESSSESETESESGDDTDDISPDQGGNGPDKDSGGGSSAGPDGSGDSGETSYTPDSKKAGGSESKSQEYSAGGNTRSHTAHQAKNSATSQSVKGNKSPLKITRGYLQKVFESLGWPATLPVDNHSLNQNGTVEKPCSIQPLAVANETSLPLVPTTALNRPIDDGDEDEEEILNKRALIKDLVGFQSFDGSFADMPQAEIYLVAMFGNEIRPALGNVLKVMSRRLNHKRNRGAANGKYFDLALAVLIIALLRKHFDSCRSLWCLMADNSLEFVKDQLAGKQLSSRDAVSIAQEAIRGVEVTMKKRNDQYPPAPAPPSAPTAPSRLQRGRNGPDYSSPASHAGFSPYRNSPRPEDNEWDTRYPSDNDKATMVDRDISWPQDSEEPRIPPRRNTPDIPPGPLAAEHWSQEIDEFESRHIPRAPLGGNRPHPGNRSEVYETLTYEELRQAQYEGQPGRTSQRDRELEQLLRRTS